MQGSWAVGKAGDLASWPNYTTYVLCGFEWVAAPLWASGSSEVKLRGWILVLEGEGRKDRGDVKSEDCGWKEMRFIHASFHHWEYKEPPGSEVLNQDGLTTDQPRNVVILHNCGLCVTHANATVG